jgi:scyllo-inositol 2-dehydrogenase (NADP+)
VAATGKQERGGPIVRVALIGFGPGGAYFHAPLIAATPGLTLSVVVTSDEGRRAQALRDYPGVTVVASAAELWDRSSEIDLVVIATPNRTHAPLVLAAFDHRMHAVVDKPFAVTTAEGRTMADAARAAGRLLIPYQNRRWDGDFLTVRALLAEGAFGTVHHFESRFDRWRPQATGRWRESGEPGVAGGLLYDLGSHLIDQALLLFGPVTAVYAELDTRRPGVTAADDVFVSLTHANGVRSHLYASALEAQATPRFRVSGSVASLVKWGFDVQEAALKAGVKPGGGAWGQEPPERWGMLGTETASAPVPTQAGDYPAFYAGVAAAIRDGAPPPVHVHEAIAMLNVIEAAQRAARERRVVELASAHE